MKQTILATVFLLICFSTSQADQVVVTGSLTGRSSPGPGLNFAFGAPGFFAQGGAAGSNSGIIVYASLIPSYSAGNSINLSLSTISSLSGSENLNGFMVHNGITYSLFAPQHVIGPRASFTFNSFATVPSSNDSAIIVTAPFTMTGILSATDPSAISLSLVGEGIASITLTRNSNGTYSFNGQQGVRYDFIETPEPTTLLLLVTGLAGFGGLIRRQSVAKRK